MRSDQEIFRRMKHLCEFPPPEVERQGSDAVSILLSKPIGHRVIGMALQTFQQMKNCFFRVAMKFHEERWKESKRVTASGTEEAFNGNEIRLRSSDDAALVLAMPPQSTSFIARAAASGLRKLVSFKLGQIIMNSGLNGHKGFVAPNYMSRKDAVSKRRLQGVQGRVKNSEFCVAATKAKALTQHITELFT
ncbi:MAG: hypothetical protein KCHDKBKB_02398 [Elusimicrobia bacterium]|nr:hypothetical protein [Elusimicrobiota bacterium]